MKSINDDKRMILVEERSPLAVFLLDKRRQLGLTQREVAEQSGLSHYKIGAYEVNVTPNARDLSSLLNTLKLSSHEKLLAIELASES